MTNFILGVFEITIGMSLFIALLLLGLKLFGGKFTAKCRYIIWALVMLRLAIPFSFGLLPTLIEIPIETELVQSENLPSVPSENTDPVTSVQPSDPGDIVVNPTVPGTPNFPTVPNVNPANPGSTPSLPEIPSESGDQAEPVIPSEPIIETPTEQPISLKRILDIAGTVYLIGVAVFLVWSLVSYFIYTRKILHSAKAADDRTRQIFSTICKKYGIKKQPTLLVASGIHSPAAFGIVRRRIVLPDIAFSENGLVGTLAHEVTHCKRGDLYMKLVELIARSLNWFNPLVHIAAFQCEMEMELSCDEKVLSGSSDEARAAYADVMLDIIRRCRRNQGALTTHFNPKKSAVTARFKNILYGSGKRRGRILIGICLVLCVLAGTFVACQIGDDLTDDAVEDSKVGIITENLSDFLTEEQIALYEKAGVIYPLFNGMSDDINILHLILEGASFEEQANYRVAHQNKDDGIHKIDTITYRPSYGEYDTFDEFKELCVSVFAEEYFEELNAADPYSSFIDHNGKLYNIDAARGGRFGYAPDEFPDEYELVEMSDEVIVFNVTGHYKSSNVNPNFTLTEETFTVKMVLTENGWRFAKFADAGLDELPLPEKAEEAVPQEIIDYALKLAKYFRDPVESVSDLREHRSLWEFLVNSIYVLHENEIVTLGDATQKEHYPQYYIPYNYMNKIAELLLGIENGLPEKLMSEDYHWLKDQDAFLYSPFSPPMFVTECIHSEKTDEGTVQVTIKISRIEEREALAVNTYTLKLVEDPEFGIMYQLLSITGETFSPLMNDHSERISLYCSTENFPHSAKHFRINFGEHEAYISPKNGALINITWSPELYCMDIAVPYLPADGIDDAVIILTTGTGTGVHTEEAYVLSGTDGTLYSITAPYTGIENEVIRDDNGKTWINEATGDRIELPDNAYFDQNYKFYIEDGCLYAKVLIGYGMLQYADDYYVIHYMASGANRKYVYANPNHGKFIDSSLTDLLAMPASELKKTYGPMTLAWSEAGPGQPVYQLGGKYGVYTVYYATDMNETIPDNRCADEIIVMKPYSDGDVCGLFIGDDISESTAGIYWSDGWYDVVNGGLHLEAKIDGYILNVGLGVSSEESKLLPNEVEATAEEWAAWESAFIKSPFGKISSIRIRKEINDQASDFTNTQTLSIPHTSLTTEMERIEENELFPAEKYSINVTGMSVPVKLYMQLDSVAAIEAHGQYVEIKELFDIYGNCSFELFESGGAVIIEGGYYEIGDVYILSPERCSEMHPGTGSSYWLHLDDSGSLKYLHKHNGIANIMQTGALSVAVAYDEFLFASGDASIKNGELFFAEPTESYTMSDRYDLDEEFRTWYSGECSTIEEKFAKNLSARNVQQYGQGPFIGYVADKETPWITLYTSKTGTYVGRIPYEIFNLWPATDRDSEWWTPGWEPEYMKYYYAEFGDFCWAAVHLGDTVLGSGRKNIATSADGGKTWNCGSCMDDYGGNHVVGMYFVSEKVAFMSFDPNNVHELIDGPEISQTTDGGKTWKRLVISVPDSLKGKKLLAGTPIHEGDVIRYPIRHNPAHGSFEGETMYIISRDNGMTWEWENPSVLYPTDEEILAEYEKATKIDDIFALAISELVGNVDTSVDKPIKIGDIHYFESKKYSSFDELRNELLTVFSEEITDEMLNTEAIRNVDGKLYAVLADGGDSAPISYRNEFAIIPISDTKLTLRVTVKVTDWYLRTYGYYASGQIIDTVNVDFTYEKIGDNWVFTEFPYIRGVYDSKLREKYTEYEFDFGKLVLPAKYDGQFIFKTDEGKYSLTAAYDPHGDGQYSDDQVFKIWRIPLGEEIPQKDGLTVTNAIGYDDKYVYMMTSGVSTSRSVTYESGFDDAVCECVTAIVTYTPHVNGWQYFGVLEHLIPIEQNTIHQSILENKATVYSPDSKSEMRLSDWLKTNEMSVSNYTVLDLNESGTPETILWLEKGENEYLGFLILNNKNEKTYAHLLYYRQFADLKTDGTFSFSGGVSNHGIGRIRFTGDTYIIDRIAYCESADNRNISYYVEGQSVSKEIFDAYIAIDNQKASVSWFDYTYSNSEQVDRVEYLPIPEITLTQVDSLPKSDSEAIFKASPIGWDPEFFVFEDGLTVYLRRYYSHECYTATLTLPEGITDGKIIHVSRGGGSGEVDIAVKATNEGKEVYLNYYFSSLNAGEFVTPPQAAMVLEGDDLDHLLDSIFSVQTGIESYTITFPEGRRFMQAASYGDVLTNVSGDTIYPSKDGVGYVVYSPMGIVLSESDEFITYKVTVKDGYITSVEEVDTVTKATVLANGKLYKGSLNGSSFCTVYGAGQLIYRSVHITDSEIWLSSNVSGTGNGATFVGTYTYDTKTGDFTAILKREYVNENGESHATGDPQKVTGKLYDYNGFLHFICQSSETGVLSPDTPLPLTFVHPSGSVKAYNSYELNDFTWNTVEAEENPNVSINPKDVAREYNGIIYNNMSFAIVDTKASKTFAAMKTNDMYTAIREINPVYSNTIEWQTFDNVLGNDALRLSYAVGGNASDICYFTFENGNLDLILTCNKSTTTIDDMVLEVYGSMGATMNLYKYENGELLCCNINSEMQKIFHDAKQIWIYPESNLQYKSHDLILQIDLPDNSDVYYGWIENGSLHLVNEKDM